MFPGLDFIFLSRRGPVFLLVYITIRKIVIQILLCPRYVFRPKLDLFFLISQPPSPIIKIKISFPYAGDSLCSRSASRTKHAVWISSLVDIFLLDISVYATLKLCLKFNVNQTGESLTHKTSTNKQTNKNENKQCTAHDYQLLTAKIWNQLRHYRFRTPISRT